MSNFFLIADLLEIPFLLEVDFEAPPICLTLNKDLAVMKLDGDDIICHTHFFLN